MKLIIAALVLLAPLSNANEQLQLNVGTFSTQSTEVLFQQWQHYSFSNVKQETLYTHLVNDGAWVIRAESEAAASGLSKKVDIDIQKYPILSWRWKVTSTPKNANDETRAGDDHAARLYIILMRRI